MQKLLLLTTHREQMYGIPLSFHFISFKLLFLDVACTPYKVLTNKFVFITLLATPEAYSFPLQVLYWFFYDVTELYEKR